MLANLLVICSIVGVAVGVGKDRDWEAYVEKLPGSAGVTADTGRERSLIELAWMAHAVYALHGSPNITADQNKNYGDLVKRGWKVAEAVQQQTYLSRKETLLATAVFTHKADKLAVVAFKGTTPSSTTDQHLDTAHIFLGVEPVAALRAGAELVAKYQKAGWHVMVTGHSLGGYMAEIVGTRLQISGVGFCAPGSHSVNPLAYDHGGAKHKGFQNVNFKDDLLGNMGAGVFIHPQWSVYVEDYAPMPTHSIVKMVASMVARGFEWTNLNVVSKCESRLQGYYTKAKVVASDKQEDVNASGCWRHQLPLLSFVVLSAVSMAFPLGLA